MHISPESVFWFHSNTLQDFFKKTDVFAPFSTDHTPIFFSFEKGIDSVRGRKLLKFKKSLISDSKYIESMKKNIYETLSFLDNQHITDDHLRWEYLKYEIQKLTKNVRKEKDSVEKELISK